MAINDPIEKVVAMPKPDTTPQFRIRQVTVGDRVGVDWVTELHMELLPFGPMAQFGDHFIREIVYVNALKDNLLEVAIAEVDGKAAGFVVYTTDADRFNEAMLRKHFLQAVWILVTSFIKQPSLLRKVPRALKVIFSRNELPGDSNNIKSEVVCFGVRPEYLSPAFVRSSKLRIGHALLEHAFTYFRNHESKRTRMIVDADNPRPLLFYQSMGATFSPCVFGGIPSYMVVFDL